MKKNIFLIAFVIVISNAFSQKWVEMASEPNANLYEIQKEFYSFFKDKDISEKSTGYKVFKRWEYFVRPRVYPTGNLSVMSQTAKNYADFLIKENIETAKNKFSSNSSVMSTTWTSVGPFGAPTGSVFGLPRKAGRDNFLTFHPTNTLTIYAGAAGGGLWKTTNGGTSWTILTDALPVSAVSDLAIDPTNPNIMYLATGGGDDFLSGQPVYSDGLYKTTDGGVTWAQAGITFSLSQSRVIHKIVIDPANSANILVATSVGIYRSTNSGASFTSINTFNCWDLKVHPTNSSIMYAASGTTFYRSTNSGASFSSVSTPISGANRISIAVTPINPTNVYLLASKSSDSQFLGVYQSTDDGQTFVTKSITPNIIGNSCGGTSTGQGQGWYDLSIAASPTNSGEVVVGGVNVWKSTNNGTSWSLIGCWNNAPNYIHADIHELEYAPNGTLFSANDGGFFKSNGGTTWTDLTANRNIAQIYKIGLSSLTANKWITGHQDNGTNIRSGATYSASLSGDGMDCFIDRTNDNVMYAEQYNGSLNRSLNGGLSWSSIVSGLTGTGDWVTPWKQDPFVANTIYVGYNTMFKSTNQGTNWTSMGNTGGGGSIVEFAIAPSNNQVIYVLHPGSVRKTTNGGATWTNVTNGLPAGNATFITIKPTDPNTAWVTVSGYTSGSKVYQTVDGGATWMNISSNLPNLPANCSVYEPGSNDRIYIGMDLGIYYKDNSSTNWTLYNTGLPNVVVMDMEISPADPGKIFAATFGRGVYTADFVPVTSAPVSDFSYYGSVCVGTNEVLVDNSSNNPTTWSWTISPTTGVTFNNTSVQTPTMLFSTPGTYTISMISGNSFGSGAMVTKTLSVFNTPTLVLSANSLTVCNQDPFSITASGATSYTWSYSGGNNATVTYTPNGDWTYTVTASNNGCVAKDTVHVTNLPKPTLVLSANSLTVCDQSTFSITVSGANTYTWSNGGGNSATATYTTGVPGMTTYTVIGDASGCFSQDTINVTAISCVGVLELAKNGTSFKVYPNPANDKLTLKMSGTKTISVNIEMFDVSGKLILKQQASFDKEKTEYSLNISSISNGIYSLKASSKDGGSQTIKIVKE
ncbi:MAG: T9SS type A sorting domain-containing protein [Bacteroidota bacterium]|nr:T9SS type A sorting domain-containing protein [Bacteroidota bacterium]